MDAGYPDDPPVCLDWRPRQMRRWKRLRRRRERYGARKAIQESLALS